MEQVSLDVSDSYLLTCDQTSSDVIVRHHLTCRAGTASPVSRYHLTCDQHVRCAQSTDIEHCLLKHRLNASAALQHGVEAQHGSKLRPADATGVRRSSSASKRNQNLYGLFRYER